MTKRNSGMTIIELMISTAIVITILSVLMWGLILLYKYQALFRVSIARDDLQLHHMQYMVSDRVWQSTIDNNSSMDCLKDPVLFPTVPDAGNCAVGAGGPVDFYGIGDVRLTDTSDPSNGFDEKGAPCIGFPTAGNKNDECPFQFAADWQLLTPTQYAVNFRSRYRGTRNLNAADEEVRTLIKNIRTASVQCTGDLVLFMPFDTTIAPPMAIDPTPGAILDSSSYGHHGSYVAGAGSEYDTGAPGLQASLKLLGNGYVEIPHSDCLSPENEITVSVWVAIEITNFGLPQAYSTFVDKMSASPNADSYVLRYHWDALVDGMARTEFCIEPGGVQNCVVAPSIALPLHSVDPINSWRHLVGTYDGAVMRLYQNGVQVQEKAWIGSIPQSTEPLRLMVEDQPTICGGLCQYGNGRIDQLRIFNRALSSAEVMSLYTTP